MMQNPVSPCRLKKKKKNRSEKFFNISPGIYWNYWNNYLNKVTRSSENSPPRQFRLYIFRRKYIYVYQFVRCSSESAAQEGNHDSRSSRALAVAEESLWTQIQPPATAASPRTIYASAATSVVLKQSYYNVSTQFINILNII